MMMIAAGGETLKIHMHSDLFFVELSLLSYVCAESSIVRKDVENRKKGILKLQKHMAVCGNTVGSHTAL